MKSVNGIARLLVAIGFGGVIAAFADVNYHTHAYVVTTVPPVVVQLPTDKGFVLGTDGIARRCPDMKNVGMYVRGEWKGAPLVFAYVLISSTTIISTPSHGYTIACLKVE